jgi:hypothetical protein
LCLIFAVSVFLICLPRLLIFHSYIHSLCHWCLCLDIIFPV